MSPMSEALKLLSLAKDALKLSYSPYSNFKVGAALLTKSNKIYTGTNIENAAYGLTLCAEAVAIAKMVSDGYNEISEILVTADKPSVCTPCGACRQRIAEFASDNTLVYLSNNDDIVKTVPLNDLLPYSFNQDNFM